jgi:AAA+ superfamily predicted ATPase
MFLTTNRIETFDPAFKSRIHLSIKYQSLSQDFRRQLWYNFIESGASTTRDPSAIEDNLLDELANHDLNGRQIRNIVRTAYALAISARERLSARHIRTTLTATNVFEDDIGSSDVLLDEDAITPGPTSRKRRRLE